MTTFISHAAQIRRLLTAIVPFPERHAKWLNTLSFLENCGARKIAACEHPIRVKEDMLKHAAEEFRHAHYLKRQIERVSSHRMDTYALSHMLGERATVHYLRALDLKTSRYLKNLSLSKNSLKAAAYLLVTYAIERRAEELYGIYDHVLRNANSRVTIKSILLEEKEHLAEMQKELEQFPSGSKHVDYVSAVESQLCQNWLNTIESSNKKTR